MTPQRLFDAVLLDVDHTPRHVLHPSHAAFYEPAGLRRLARHLKPGGVFALWSDDPPDAKFMTVLTEVFEDARSHVVQFPNPLTGGHSTKHVLHSPVSDTYDDSATRSSTSSPASRPAG